MRRISSGAINPRLTRGVVQLRSGCVSDVRWSLLRFPSSAVRGREHGLALGAMPRQAGLRSGVRREAAVRVGTRESYGMGSLTRFHRRGFHTSRVVAAEWAMEEDEERYYSMAPPDPLDENFQALHDNRYDQAEVAACLAQYEESLPTSPTLKASHPLLFHFQFTEEFCDIDEDLQLPPRLHLAPGQTVTVRQVVRLLQQYQETRATRSAAENESTLNQLLGLLDHIVVHPYEDPALLSEDKQDGVAEHRAPGIIRASSLPHGNNMLSWRDLLQSLAQVGRVDEAFRVFDTLESRHKIIPNHPLFVQLWQLCKEHDRLDKVMSYFNYFIKCKNRSVGSHDWLNTRTVNTILASLVPQSNLADALQVWKRMRLERTEPDGFSYSCIIQIMLNQGRISSALELFEEMKAAMSPTHENYNQILRGLVHNAVDPNTVKLINDEHDSSGREYAYSLVLKYFEELRARFEPDGLTYALVLKGCANHGDYDKAFSIFAEVEKSGNVRPSHATQLISVCGNNWRGDRALDVFWTMEARFRVRPNPSCFNALLVALVRSGRYDLLEPTMQRVHDTYGLVIWPKTAGYILTNAVGLEDKEFTRRYARLLEEKYPFVYQKYIVQTILRRSGDLMASSE